MDDNEIKWVTATGLAAVLSLTPQRIGQLHKEGIVIAKPYSEKDMGARLYDLPLSVKGYINMLLEKEAKKNSIPELEIRRQEAEVKYKAAKARKAEFEVAELEGSMHRSEHVAIITNKLVSTIKGLLSALPGRLAATVTGCKRQTEAADLMQTEINAVLLELSEFEYDSSDYEALLKSEEALRIRQEVESDDAEPSS